MKSICLYMLVAGLAAIFTYSVAVPRDSMFLFNWNPAWVQAIGSICAVLVAVYVPWKIDKDKRLAEERRAEDLKKLSLKAIAYEAWLMKEFFRHVEWAVDKGDKGALESFAKEEVPIDSKSSMVMESGKYMVVSNLNDKISTCYMNAVSRRFLVLQYVRAYLMDLNYNGGGFESCNKTVSIRLCEEGDVCCSKIIDIAKKECEGLKFGFKVEAYK